MNSLKMYKSGFKKCIHGKILCKCCNKNCREEEAFLRNKIINKHHQRVPNYCIWSEYDIRKETEYDRLGWWKHVAGSYIEFEKQKIKADEDEMLKLFDLEEIDRERQSYSNNWRNVGQNGEIWVSDI